MRSRFTCRSRSSAPLALAAALALAAGEAGAVMPVAPDNQKYCETRFPGDPSVSPGMDPVTGKQYCLIVRCKGKPCTTDNYNFEDAVFTKVEVDVAMACLLSTGSAEHRFVFRSFAVCGDGSMKSNERRVTEQQLRNYCAKLAEGAYYVPGNAELALAICWRRNERGIEVPAGPNPDEACLYFYGTKKFRWGQHDGQLAYICLTSEAPSMRREQRT